MAKIPIIKTKELIKVLHYFGFTEFHRVGSHAQFKHKDGRRTTVPIRSGKDIRKGTLKAILREIDISTQDLVKALKG
ncbi:type II toxin-antitoxin system HicA family toxin [Candidatus Gribaldobacteria bacterium]|nr:type II toxin-antitoxin system HicA family toxin [Candidatus Gribaldobacteria bacterium]